jgi:DNA-binding CsgD family transcriptional regulator
MSCKEFENTTSKGLSRRELECLYWSAQGKSIDEVAIILNISKSTVRNYLDSVKTKLNSFKITKAIYQAAKLGLI